MSAAAADDVIDNGAQQAAKRSLYKSKRSVLIGKYVSETQDYLQEELWQEPWRLLLGCMLLNKTSGKQVRSVFWRLLQLCPTPEAAVTADVDDIRAIITPLGLHNKRAVAVQRFSYDFIHKELHTNRAADMKMYVLSGSLLIAPEGADPELPADARLSPLAGVRDLPGSWPADVNGVIPVKGMQFLEELAFFHKPTSTLILTDLAFNFDKNDKDTGLLQWLYLLCCGGFRPCCVTTFFNG
eukprot:gene2680-2981_t